MVNTLLHDEFQEFLNTKIINREYDLIKEQNLQVRAIPEIFNILKRSKVVSSSKGKSHFLLRPVIKRKSKNHIKLENQKVENDSKYANELIDKLEEIIAKISQFDQMNEETLANKEKLFRLYFNGVIDTDGKLKRNE